MNLGDPKKRIFQSNEKELKEIFILYNDPKMPIKSCERY